MKNIGLVVHVGRPRATELAEKLIRFLPDKGIILRLPESDADALGHARLSVSNEKFGEDLDLAIALGGDGTVLRAVQLIGRRETPVLGVNLGRFGFLAEVEEKHLESILERVLAGRFQVQKRMMLSCELTETDSKREGLALNEIVIERGSQPKLLELAISINGDFFNRYACDGLILSTPTGSTAYSLSANGPIVSPRIRVVLMTPISSHSFFNRTVVLEETDRIEITLPNPEKQKVTINIDGETFFRDDRFDRLEVFASPVETNLISLGEKTFYQILREKLKIWDTLGG